MFARATLAEAVPSPVATLEHDLIEEAHDSKLELVWVGSVLDMVQAALTEAHINGSSI